MTGCSTARKRQGNESDHEQETGLRGHCDGRRDEGIAIVMRVRCRDWVFIGLSVDDRDSVGQGRI